MISLVRFVSAGRIWKKKIKERRIIGRGRNRALQGFLFVFVVGRFFFLTSAMCIPQNGIHASRDTASPSCATHTHTHLFHKISFPKIMIITFRNIGNKKENLIGQLRREQEQDCKMPMTTRAHKASRSIKTDQQAQIYLHSSLQNWKKKKENERENDCPDKWVCYMRDQESLERKKDLTSGKIPSFILTLRESLANRPSSLLAYHTHFTPSDKTRSTEKKKNLLIVCAKRTKEPATK